MFNGSKNAKVVVTGVGLISPLGNSPEDLWAALSSGRSGVVAREESTWARHLTVPGVGEATQFTGTIDGFGELDAEVKKVIRKGLKVMSRETQMAVASAQLAMKNAALAPQSFDPERSGVVFGSDYMLTEPEDYELGVRACMTGDGFAFDRWGKEGLSKVTPLWLLKYLPNMPASHVAIFNDLRGPSNSLTHRENSSNLAVGEAARIIQRGDADLVLAGSTGTRIHPMKSIHALQQEEIAMGGGPPSALCRPFDRARSGMVLGEGAGVVVLESLRHAEARGAPLLAEVVGFGSACVTSPRMVATRRRSLAIAASAALAEARVPPEELGHVHAHGLGTRYGDWEESLAIRDVLGDAADRVPVTAAKSYFGNLGAGSGMVELIASVLAMRSGSLFPIQNLDEVDPQCPIRAISKSAPPGNCFINLCTTPQGQSSAVVVRLLP